MNRWGSSSINSFKFQTVWDRFFSEPMKWGKPLTNITYFFICPSKKSWEFCCFVFLMYSRCGHLIFLVELCITQRIPYEYVNKKYFLKICFFSQTCVFQMLLDSVIYLYLRKISGFWFFPSTMWDLGINFRLIVWVASFATCWVILPAQTFVVNYSTDDKKVFRVQYSLYDVWIIGANPLIRVLDMSDLALAISMMSENGQVYYL